MKVYSKYSDQEKSSYDGRKKNHRVRNEFCDINDDNSDFSLEEEKSLTVSID